LNLVAVIDADLPGVATEVCSFDYATVPQRDGIGENRGRHNKSNG